MYNIIIRDAESVSPKGIINMMNLNKTELKVILNLLDDARETPNDVATLTTKEFNAMIIEKEEIRTLYNKVWEALRPEESKEDSIFGV